MTRIVVTGAAGYIGTQLVKDLLLDGHEVLGIDRLFFGPETLSEFSNNKNFKLLKKDIRDVEVADLSGYEVVCDLACLSNDPAGDLDPRLTYEINRDGRIHIAKTAKEAGVRKYIISSSCSVYGQGDEPSLNEMSTTNPISVYAKSTLDAEQENLKLNSEKFSVTALRNATVFGLSKRMRFDLVVNLMTLTAFQKSRIIVMGGGLQWRPLVHVSDVSKAFVTVIKAPSSKVSGEIFNVGLNNFQVKKLAFLVKENINNQVEIDIAPDDADKRDYNVSFEKIKNTLGYEPEISVEDGIKEIYNALLSGSVDVGPRTVTVQWYRSIVESKNLLDSIILNGRVI
jgi:nucleoside-diphosphate-sugar epimerase